MTKLQQNEEDVLILALQNDGIVDADTVERQFMSGERLETDGGSLDTYNMLFRSDFPSNVYILRPAGRLVAEYLKRIRELAAEVQAAKARHSDLANDVLKPALTRIVELEDELREWRCKTSLGRCHGCPDCQPIGGIRESTKRRNEEEDRALNKRRNEGEGT